MELAANTFDFCRSFVERSTLFNVFSCNNPGANYVTNAASIPACTVLTPGSANCTAANLKQLGIPGGALGDFFGPGTTVGIPFAAQLGLRLSF